MTIIETRLENLLALAGKYRFDKDFCEAIGVQPSYLSQLRRGDKTLGNKLAREIEARLGLDDGALDAGAAPEAEATPAQGIGLMPEVMTAAFAMQGMEPALRSAIVRMVLLVSAGRTPVDVPAVTDEPAPAVPDTRAPPAPPTARKATAPAFEIKHDISKERERGVPTKAVNRPKAAAH